MLSVANVRSAKGAADYFAADNYYTAGAPEAVGEWFGTGAGRLGLTGQVGKDAFEALLVGTLPNGVQLGSVERHRAGTDLTFSLPKSWSLIALVGGDQRVLDAWREAVKDTLRWAERNAAATRVMRDGRDTAITSDNLVVALFAHDTSRAQDPQAHIHAVVANATEGPDGKWRVLHNDKLWSLNTLFNAIAMASFRGRVEALGYRIGDVGKHGNFEAAGIPREALMTFSTRRHDILSKAAELGAQTPQAMHAATMMTRPRKAPNPNRDAMRAAWVESARAIGLELSDVIAEAHRNATIAASPWSRLGQAIGVVAQSGKGMMARLSERLGLVPSDPYLPRALGRMSAPDLAAAHAVASALRHLEQREAAFLRTDILKAALDTGLPLGLDAIERRVAFLERSGQLVAGHGQGREMITTAGALAVEQRILDGVDQGRGQGRAFVDPDAAAARLQAAAAERSGITLNQGQQAAGEMLLASTDRIVAIQGVAGAGKSSVLAPVAEVIAGSGRRVLGLAIQNTLVQMLERETGIPSMTVARFLRTHHALLEPTSDPAALADARRALGGGAIFVDEASMLSNGDQLKLVRIANLIGVGRMAFVGDAQQLGAVDAGKPFALMQGHGAPTALMSENLRARGAAVRAAALATQAGRVGEALDALAPFTIEAPGQASKRAATIWLALPAADRDRTAIYASGRRLRSEINQEVQEGLAGRGEIGPATMRIDVLQRVNLTNEELRYAHNYAPGMVVEITHAQRALGPIRGQADVASVDPSAEVVTLRYDDGTQRSFRPERLRSRPENSSIQLYERRSIDLHERDRIRWTANDWERGLFNAAQAQVTAIGPHGVSIMAADGQSHLLPQGDPMLQRIDLAYALNAHMAQGLTADRGIAVMEARDTKLVTQQNFLVTVTRVRDELTLVVDRAGALERLLSRHVGGKASSWEMAGRKGVTASDAKMSMGPASRQNNPEKLLDLGGMPVKPFEIDI